MVALAASGVAAPPGTIPAVPAPPASVVAPVELTALGGDSSLMDIIGTLTGLNWIIPILDNPDYPWFPFVISLEALGELFFVIPVTLAIGAPLILITEGFEGFQDAFSGILGSAFDGLKFMFDELLDWYSTRNWFTGQLLDPGTSEAVALSGWGDLFQVFTTGDLDNVVAPLDIVDVVPPLGLDEPIAVDTGDLGLPVDTVDPGLPLDGLDAVLTFIGLGDLID
ncbi:hypothetical protein A5735_05480 [Mycolicibacter heraklionensis]|nr:hypothetical protein A5735_05480 [Mycolicibacter heraklionensis]